MDIWLVMPTEGSKKSDIRPRSSFSRTKGVYEGNKRTSSTTCLKTELPEPLPHEGALQPEPPSYPNLQGHHLETATEYKGSSHDVHKVPGLRILWLSLSSFHLSF